MVRIIDGGSEGAPVRRYTPRAFGSQMNLCI